MKNMNNEESLDYFAEKKRKYYTPTLEQSNQIKFSNEIINNINNNIQKEKNKEIQNEKNKNILNIDDISTQNKNILKELRRIFIKYGHKIEKNDKDKMNNLFDILEKNL